MPWIIEVRFPNQEAPHYLTMAGVADVSPPIYTPIKEDAFQCGREQDAEALTKFALPRDAVTLVDLDAE